MPEDENLARDLFLSPIESVAYVLGIVTVFSVLETATLDGEDPAAIDWHVLRRRLNGISNHLGLATFLTKLDPDEEYIVPALRKGGGDSDPEAFTTLMKSLLALRKARGTAVEPPGKPDDPTSSQAS